MQCRQQAMGDNSDNGSGSEDKESTSALAYPSPWNMIQGTNIFTLFKELSTF